jgi:hypothetical protein
LRRPYLDSTAATLDRPSPDGTDAGRRAGSGTMPTIGKGRRVGFEIPLEVWLPITTLVLGQVILIGIEWLKVRWERTDRIREQQRQALYELQDALDALYAATQANVREKRRWERLPMDQRPSLDNEESIAPWTDAESRTKSAIVRISDDQARALAREVWKKARGAFLTGPFDAKSNELLQTRKAHDAATERIGELIRSL